MTATVGNFYSGTSDQVRNQLRSRFYRTLTGSTASTELAGELPDSPSLSMLPPRNGEQETPLLMLVYYGTHEGGLEGNPEIKAKLSQPGLWQHSEPDASVWRGVFSPLYHPKVLFSEQIEVRTADLPRWKPRITIDRRTLTRGDDE